MKKTLLATSLITAILSSQTEAADINFSGYGSIRGGLLVNDDVTPELFGYDDKIDFSNESLFALQTKANLNEQWNATIVLQAQGKKDFDVAARWAYLSYQYSPETTVTLGRFALPFFRNSDTQDIGYSHNYSRLPKSVYQGRDADIVEGIHVMHSTFAGDGDLTIRGSLGSFSGELNGRPFEFKNIMQVSVDYTYEWFSFFAGALTGDTTLTSQESFNAGFIGALGGLGYDVRDRVAYNPANVAVYDMDNLYLDDDKGVYLSSGITIDYENWLFNAEYAVYDIDDSFYEEANVLFASLGYRFDKAVVTLVHQDYDFNYKYNQASSSDPFVNAFIIGLSDSFTKPNTYDAQGIHLRYDASEGVAYKLEFSVINNDLADKSASLFTFGVDFIY